jgi:hypothetical protein
MKANRSIGLNFYKVQFVPLYRGDGCAGYLQGLFAKNYEDAKRKIIKRISSPSRSHTNIYKKVHLEILDNTAELKNLPKTFMGGDFLKIKKISYNSLTDNYKDCNYSDVQYDYHGIRIIQYDQKRIKCIKLFRDDSLGLSLDKFGDYLTKKGILPAYMTTCPGGSYAWGPPRYN